jgi:hypothetical protein
MSRRLLSAVTITVLLLVLVLGAVIGWQALSAPLPGSDEPAASTPSPDCDPGLSKGDLVHASDVTVSVFNAGTRSGLAGQTQEQLTARGFIAGDVGNAPGTLAGVRFVRVLADTTTDPAAKLVARQFGRHTLIQKEDDDLGPGVEVVVGDRFVGLVKAPRQLKAAASGSGC